MNPTTATVTKFGNLARSATAYLRSERGDSHFVVVIVVVVVVVVVVVAISGIKFP